MSDADYKMKPVSSFAPYRTSYSGCESYTQGHHRWSAVGPNASIVASHEDQANAIAAALNAAYQLGRADLLAELAQIKPIPLTGVNP